MPTSSNLETVALPKGRGDREAAFRELIDRHRAELHAHCYRMLGSAHDADDALQDALLRAWRALPRFRGDSSLKTWLYRIATNVCLDTIARRPKRVLPIDYGPPTRPGTAPGRPALPESQWIEPYPDERVGIADGATAPEARLERREALELAFVAALQHLPPRQRTTLILRDVLGFSAKETAESLETTVPAANGALRRARAAIEERIPERSQQATLRALGDRKLREIVERFADCFERGDIDAILAMLTEDVTFAMPPFPDWCRSRDDVAKSWLMPEGPPPRLRYVATRANGQLALGTYGRRADGVYAPIALDVLTLRGDLISEVIAFRNPSAFGRFELPGRLPALS
jgi:RNA polymerase sigma-70 factor (ECF subfamily)